MICLPSKKHLTEELVHLLFCTLECASATRRNPVHASSRAPESSLGRAQISLLLQSVRDRVQRARAQSVPVSGEFFDHRKPIERARGSVMHEVQANQTTVVPAVRHSRASLVQWCAKLESTHMRNTIYENAYIEGLTYSIERGDLSCDVEFRYRCAILWSLCSNSYRHRRAGRCTYIL